jgi:eukaryotic-like serine/threonine-protein kinase
MTMVQSMVTSTTTPLVANRYVVEEELASGGMGVVYRVHDRSTGEKRALKRLKSDATAHRYLVEAFEREYQVLAGIDHPRIIRVYDYGVDTVGPYYTMELLVGQDMRHAAPMPYRLACRCLRDVATSLALLHARRFLHRDLSPRNVRVTSDGHCKLLDFGALSSFGNVNSVVGTAPAIPPEALGGAPLDQRSDLYSLGALAYWMFTGTHAYPAHRFEELEALWKTPPAAPSTLAPDLPPELDELVLSLLSLDPRARPASAAEVISRVNTVAELAAEDADDVERLAESFLLTPRFVGRSDALEHVRRSIEALSQGRGGALRIEGVAGMGRTRLLEEIGVRAQVAGAGVVRVDASTYRDWSGTARALVLRLLDSQPRLARERAEGYRSALSVLGSDVEARLASAGSGRPSATSTPPAADNGPVSRTTPSSATHLDQWFVDISHTKPLVVQVDNVDDADDASLGLLVALAKASTENPLLVVVSERIRRQPRDASGLVTLRGQCARLELDGLSKAETLELCESLFAGAQNVERFADWLYGRTEGCPLHCIEISRRLLVDRVIRYVDGMWSLPAERPTAELPSGLEEAISLRLVLMSEPARGLAECLCLQREQPTLAVCRRLVDDGDDMRVLHVLDELARNDVLYADQGGYRFSSTALRDALVAGMDAARREENHRRLGEALAFLAGPAEDEARIEAGWHLIQGADDVRGADMIAEVASNSAKVRQMIANLHHVGRPIEAALQVYKRHRRSIYERVPLLAALAHASYYEDRSWGDRYGDDALDACEDLSGVRTARSLRRFFGRWLAMVVGIFLAMMRFHLAPKRERRYRFQEMLVQLCGAVTTLTGTAALSLDIERATKVTQVLELFSALPNRLAPVGIYQFCLGLREIGREDQAKAYRSFETLLRRFEDPHYYWELPADARILYVTGAHFARGVFATMRADGRPALESADALEASGLKMYTMIASELRFLYHMNRGEFAAAAPHRELVELHAAHVGSAWQVETWEPAALIPVASRLRDVTSLTQISARLEELSVAVPSLKLHRRLAYLALMRARGAFTEVEQAILEMLGSAEPRSFIGWAQTAAITARALNDVGEHDTAMSICEDALVHINDEDREWVSLFIDLDIEMALAQASLGEVDKGLARIDGLLERFRNCDHPLLQGSLHEARARIAWNAGQVAEYLHSLTIVERWYRGTGTPALIAKYERLASLRDARDRRPASNPGLDEPLTEDAQTRLRGTAGTTDPADVPTAAAAAKRAAST